jgi:hypothetical protein
MTDDVYEAVARRLLSRELEVRAGEVAVRLREAAVALENGDDLDRGHYWKAREELDRAEDLLEDYVRPLVEDDVTASRTLSIEIPGEVADDLDLEEGDSVLYQGETDSNR